MPKPKHRFTLGGLGQTTNLPPEAEAKIQIYLRRPKPKHKLTPGGLGHNTDLPTVA